VDANGVAVGDSVDLAGTNFTAAQVVTSDDVASAFQQWMLNATLDNGANLEIYIWQFTSDTSINFANSSVACPANTIKLGLQIQNWPFRNTRNSLEVVLDSQARTNSGISCNQTDSQSDENGNLRWFTINIDGVIMYGQFLDKAELDGAVRVITFQLDKENNVVTATIPHFWDYAVIDPSYAVLIGDVASTCASTGLTVSTILIIAIVVPVVVLAIIVVAWFLLLNKRFYTWRKVRKAARQSEAVRSELSRINTPALTPREGYSTTSAVVKVE